MNKTMKTKTMKTKPMKAQINENQRISRLLSLRNLRISKKAYYFTLDAFIAVIILAAGFFLIKSTYITVPMSSDVEHISDDILDLLSSAKAAEFGIYPENNESTALEAIGESYSKNEAEGINLIIQEIIEKNKVIPENYEVSLYVDNSRVYGDEASIQGTKLLITARRIVFGYYEDSSYNIIFWGPYEIKVKTWQKT